MDLECCEGNKPYQYLFGSAIRGGAQRRNRVSCIHEVVLDLN
tara:strand:+ start:243 stop:368 length:126 start_codon:yes stop_codon:yes gene_type:complete